MTDHDSLVGNVFMSMTHDFSTGVTTGLLAFIAEPELDPRYHHCISKLRLLHEQLRLTESLWLHPMLLPTLLIQVTHYDLASVCSVLMGDMDSQDRSIGITPRLDIGGGADATQNWPEDVDIKKATSAMQEMVTWQFRVREAVEWQRGSLNFLIRLCKELEGFKTGNTIRPSGDQDIVDLLNHISSKLCNLEGWMVSGQRRIEMVMNVVSALIPVVAGRWTDNGTTHPLSYPGDDADSHLHSSTVPPPRRTTS